MATAAAKIGALRAARVSNAGRERGRPDRVPKLGRYLRPSRFLPHFDLTGLMHTKGYCISKRTALTGQLEMNAPFLADRVPLKPDKYYLRTYLGADSS